jgi:hypothetical protein
VLGQFLRDRLGPLAKTYPVSAVGKAVVEGMQKRSRSVVVPGWARVLVTLRTFVQPLTERTADNDAAEADRLFLEDVQARGEEAASAPVGPGGEAATRREHATRP